VIWPGNGIFGRNEFALGLDLKGGSHLVYQIDLSKKDPSQTDADVISAVKNKIERRVNAYGVTEPIVQTINNERGSFVLVQLPGVKDIDEAIKLVGQTAELDFREMELDATGKLGERERWAGKGAYRQVSQAECPGNFNSADKSARGGFRVEF
jgi:preprotein translocase subunit SecD